MITRDAVQGFIDGHKLSGHPSNCLESCVKTWLKQHHTYKQDEKTINLIVSDLDSYKK